MLKKKTIFEIHHDTYHTESRIVKFLFNNFKVLNSQNYNQSCGYIQGCKKIFNK
jgi:hypothetical protein